MSVTVRAGDLLISPPNIIDPRFHKTVLFVTHHAASGAFALCVNKPTTHTLKDIIEPLNLELDHDCMLYWGGPVSPTTVWMMHDNSWAVENTIRVNSDWSITSNLGMFHKMAQGQWPQRYRIMFGHASWAPGQLDRELEGREPWDHDSSWLVVKDPDAAWLYDQKPHALWNSGCGICSQQTVNSWMS
jgi:putative transcriptional regulator